MSELEQPKLLDDRQIDVTYVDFEQKLRIPENALVYKAQRLQVVLDKFEKLLKTSPQQFSMQNYLQALNEYTKIVDNLRKGADDAGDLEDVPEGETEAVGEGDAASVVAGVSTDNPTAG